MRMMNGATLMKILKTANDNAQPLGMLVFGGRSISSFHTGLIGLV